MEWDKKASEGDERKDDSNGCCQPQILANTQESHSVRQTSDKRQRIDLLIDLQAKVQEGKGAGYQHWAKVFNLK